jgi:ACR3 family arsenite efflux pump ArsB
MINYQSLNVEKLFRIRKQLPNIGLFSTMAYCAILAILILFQVVVIDNRDLALVLIFVPTLGLFSLVLIASNIIQKIESKAYDIQHPESS